jgi:hypothetical protein
VQGLQKELGRNHRAKGADPVEAMEEALLPPAIIDGQSFRVQVNAIRLAWPSVKAEVERLRERDDELDATYKRYKAAVARATDAGNERDQAIELLRKSHTYLAKPYRLAAYELIARIDRKAQADATTGEGVK